MGIGCKAFREGRYLYAQQVFGAVSRYESSRKRFALYGLALTMTRNGQLQEAKNKFEELLHSNQEGTVFKANVLRSLAEVKITLGQLEGIDGMLIEASTILEKNGLLQQLASTIYLQGLVHLIRGQLEKATDKINWATSLAEIDIPSHVPLTFIIEQQMAKAPASADIASQMAAMGINT